MDRYDVMQAESSAWRSLVGYADAVRETLIRVPEVDGMALGELMEYIQQLEAAVQAVRPVVWPNL